MSIVKVKVLKLEHFDPSFDLPAYGTEGAAGADLRASLPGGGELIIGPGERQAIPTGLCFEIPVGFEIQVRPRSGLSLRSDLLVVNAPGTIDSDYRGEVKILMGNLGRSDVVVKHGDRLAQALIAPVWRMEFQNESELSDTARGRGGFGSTGSN